MGSVFIRCHHLQRVFAVAMRRTVEPELMEELQQVLAYAGADFRTTDQALVDRLVEIFGEAVGTQLVDLGCGPGNISFRLAERFPQASVLGLDGAADVVQVAEQELAKRELRSRVVDWLHFDQVHLRPKRLPYGGDGGGEQQPVTPSP
jgi:tRNA G46 methylase TrmB